MIDIDRLPKDMSEEEIDGAISELTEEGELSKDVANVVRSILKDKAEKEWLKVMLAYAVNLMSQLCDLVDEGILDEATTGPADDPDRYDIDGLLREIRSRYPEM